MSNPTHPPGSDGHERPVYFTHLEGALPERRTQTVTNRLIDCQDEIRRLRDVLEVLDDAFGSRHHGDASRMVPYGALSRHVEESLRCLGAELGDLVALFRQRERP